MTALGRVMPLVPFRGGRALRLFERNVLVYRRTWMVLLSGFFEPLFYLVGIGFGLGQLIGTVEGPGGQPIPYAVFVAPALLATASMNGAIYDSTFNMFFKLKYAKTYDAILATPLGVGDVAVGEVAWALTRGTLYALGFMVVILLLGLALSPWALLAVPAAVLIGFAAAAIGAAATSFMRKWQDFDLIFVVTMPLFLFSATFFPITAYPEPFRTIVELTPLYRGVHLIRGLTTDNIEPMLVVDVAYLVVLGLIGLVVVSRRLSKLLLK
jgi:lipooligosaccharide transport system permease protein